MPREVQVPLSEQGRPFSSSHFITGEIAGVSVRFLVDTGCTTNILSSRTVRKLPVEVRETVEADKAAGSLADGTPIDLAGSLRLDMQVEHLIMEETFMIGGVDEEGILGMPFLNRYGCAVVCDPPTLEIRGHRVRCTDREGRTLVGETAPDQWTLVDTSPSRDVRSMRDADLKRKAATVGPPEQQRETYIQTSTTRRTQKAGRRERKQSRKNEEGQQPWEAATPVHMWDPLAANHPVHVELC